MKDVCWEKAEKNKLYGIEEAHTLKWKGRALAELCRYGDRWVFDAWDWQVGGLFLKATTLAEAQAEALAHVEEKFADQLAFVRYVRKELAK